MVGVLEMVVIIIWCKLEFLWVEFMVEEERVWADDCVLGGGE